VVPMMMDPLESPLGPESESSLEQAARVSVAMAMLDTSVARRWFRESKILTFSQGWSSHERTTVVRTSLLAQLLHTKPVDEGFFTFPQQFVRRVPLAVSKS